jgi:hypothetical protein
MGLKNSFILLFLVSCSPRVDVILEPTGPTAYRRCDMLCKQEYGQGAEVFVVKKSISGNKTECYCR